MNVVFHMIGEKDFNLAAQKKSLYLPTDSMYHK